MLVKLKSIIIFGFIRSDSIGNSSSASDSTGGRVLVRVDGTVWTELGITLKQVGKVITLSPS